MTTPHHPYKALENLSKTVRVNPVLEGAAYDRHTKGVVIPASQFDPDWLQVGQQLLHMTPRQKAVEGQEKIRWLCTETMKHLREAAKGKYGKLIMELGRIREEWG